MKKPLASGRTADVFAWDNGRVVKVFKPWVTPSAVESERRAARVAYSAGLPVPAVGETVACCGRIGLLFAHIDGSLMMDRLTADPESVKPLAHQLAELHGALHRHIAPPELPTQKSVLRDRIQRSSILSPTERHGILVDLARMPDGVTLCHGDFHPGNVMLTDRGPVILDWMDAVRGNPVADVARTSLLFLGHIEAASVPDNVRADMILYHETYLETYVAAYFEQTHTSRVPRRTHEAWRREYQRWLPILAAARLSERIPEQTEWLLQLVRIGIENREGSGRGRSAQRCDSD